MKRLPSYHPGTCHPLPRNWSTYVLFFTSFKWRAWSVYFAFLDCWWQWNAKIKWKTESFSIFETKLLQFGVKGKYYVTIDCVGFVFSDLLLGAHFLISLRESECNLRIYIKLTFFKTPSIKWCKVEREGRTETQWTDVKRFLKNMLTTTALYFYNFLLF